VLEMSSWRLCRMGGNHMDVGAFGDKHKLLTEGLHRVCTAQQTLDRVFPIKHKFGITRLANVTGLDRVGLPVVLAIRPNARSISVSQGKGSTLVLAKVSALMEAIEIWHAEHFDQPVFFASFEDLSEHHEFIDLNRLPEVRGRIRGGAERLLWVYAHELMSDRNVLVPVEMVHADYTHPLFPGTGYFPSSTNGLASGNNQLEAICHAICEVIERDALALWHHRTPDAQQLQQLDLHTINDPTCLAALQKFADADLDCLVWNVTSDVAVATFMCVIFDRQSETNHVGLGSGTHPDRTVALQRALNEAAQTRLNYITGAREDLSFEEYSASGRAQKMAAFAGLPDGATPSLQFGDVPTSVNADLESDLEFLKRCLRQAGIKEVAVVDLEREEIRISVVRVIVPGLEAPHDDEGYDASARARGIVAEGPAR